ncbi:chromate transporter [Burkholderiales bacterium GJ-E10]|nr:chromate transporter [Burkholderiales bacterium GJ-E10]
MGSSIDSAGSPWEVLRAFLALGLRCFGGPVAHIGYFHDEFVMRRRWLDEEGFADLVGLCQFLPGPASSQIGFAIGLLRAGYLGGFAAWFGFTLPSAAALVLFARAMGAFAGPAGAALLHGLKLVAVAVVAQAVLGMARNLCSDRARASIALVAALIVLWGASSAVQIVAIMLGATAGLLFCRGAAPRTAATVLAFPVSPAAGAAALIGFFGLLAGVPVWRSLADGMGLAHFEAFYRAGALVFGGGHVVLPLLHDAFVSRGWVDDRAFLAGYGAAQAVPGPLFTFAAYLGFLVSPQHRLSGAVLGLLGIFLPGILVLVGALPYWSRLRAGVAARAAMRGVNAAVVGLLAAALYSPIWTTTIRGPRDFAIALAGFVMLTVWKAPPVAVVAFCAIAATIIPHA